MTSSLLMSLTTEQVQKHYLHVAALKNESSPKTRNFWDKVVNGIVTLDPAMIVEGLERARTKIQAAKAAKKSILVVCNKSMYTDELIDLATKQGFHFLNDKIPGGFITNFKTLTRRIRDLNRQLLFLDSEDFLRLTKKEQVANKRDVAKIEKIYGGVKGLRDEPDLVVVVDGASMTNLLHEVTKKQLDNIVICSTDFAQSRDKEKLVVANMKGYQSINFILQYLFS